MDFRGNVDFYGFSRRGLSACQNLVNMAWIVMLMGGVVFPSTAWSSPIGALACGGNGSCPTWLTGTQNVRIDYSGYPNATCSQWEGVGDCGVNINDPAQCNCNGSGCFKTFAFEVQLPQPGVSDAAVVISGFHREYCDPSSGPGDPEGPGNPENPGSGPPPIDPHNPGNPEDGGGGEGVVPGAPPGSGPGGPGNPEGPGGPGDPEVSVPELNIMVIPIAMGAAGLLTYRVRRKAIKHGPKK